MIPPTKNPNHNQKSPSIVLNNIMTNRAVIKKEPMPINNPVITRLYETFRATIYPAITPPTIEGNTSLIGKITSKWETTSIMVIATPNPRKAPAKTSLEEGCDLDKVIFQKYLRCCLIKLHVKWCSYWRETAI